MSVTYTVTEDYYEPYSDGGGKRLIFRAGQVISWQAAKDVGLVKGAPPKQDAEEAEPTLPAEPVLPFVPKRGK